MESHGLENKLSQNSANQDQQKQCQLCLNEFSNTNHPMKICIKDHNMCEKCVEQILFLGKKKSQSSNQKTNHCPFCHAFVDQRKIVVNYKLLNSIKYKKLYQSTLFKEKNKIALNLDTSLFEKLSQQNYRLIMSFVSQNDKIRFSSTSLFLRSLLMTDQIWGQFEISDCLSMNFHSQNHQDNWNLRIKWIYKYFWTIKPHQVRIIIRDFCDDDSLLNFFFFQYEWVTKLTFFCQSQQAHLLVAKAYRQVQFLSVSSNVFSDDLFSEMASKMKKIKHFQVIKDDINFTAKNLSKYFPEGLESIVLKPHIIEFEQIALLARDNPQNLTDIELDIEDCPEQILVEILEPLKNVEVLKLFHMQNIHIPEKVANSLSSNVRQLYLTKAYEMPMLQIINKIASPKLLTLDFTEVHLLNDDNIQTIAKECPYLKRLNISWCTKISENSVAKLIKSCLSLQYLNLTGLKCFTDKVFEQYAEFVTIFDEDRYDQLKNKIRMLMDQAQNLGRINDQTINFLKVQNQIEFVSKISQIKSLRNLKQLYCVSCNGISDAILKIIYLVNRKVNTVNYYGNCMGLYTNQDMFG